MGGRLLAFPSRPTPTPDPPQTLKHQHRCPLRRVTNRPTGVCDDCMMRLGKSPNAVAYWCAECDYDLCMACATSGRKVITCNFLNRKLWNLLLKVAKSTLVGDCLVPCMQRAWCIAHGLRAVCVARRRAVGRAELEHRHHFARAAQRRGRRQGYPRCGGQDPIAHADVELCTAIRVAHARANRAETCGCRCRAQVHE